MDVASSPDRYQSFYGLNCDQRAETLLQRVCTTARTQQPDNPLWHLVQEKYQAAYGPDALFLVHAYVFYMRDLLEQYQDSDGLELLDAIERDCC